jgi:hypothetical protein
VKMYFAFWDSMFSPGRKKPPCGDGLRAYRDKPTQLPEYVRISARESVCFIIKAKIT